VGAFSGLKVLAHGHLFPRMPPAFARFIPRLAQHHLVNRKVSMPRGARFMMARRRVVGRGEMSNDEFRMANDVKCRTANFDFRTG